MIDPRSFNVFPEDDKGSTRIANFTEIMNFHSFRKFRRRVQCWTYLVVAVNVRIYHLQAGLSLVGRDWGLQNNKQVNLLINSEYFL